MSTRVLTLLSLFLLPYAAAAQQPSEIEILAGKQVFGGKGNCITCHGSDATGTTLAPDLADSETINLASGTVEEIAALIRQGVAQPKRHPAPMPARGGAALSETEVRAVAAYVWSLAPESGSATSVSHPEATVEHVIVSEPATPTAQLVWEPIVEMGGELFPSFVVATSTMNVNGEREIRNGNYIGDQLGQLGIKVRAPHNNARVRVEIEAPALAAPSKIETTLPVVGQEYELFPTILYDYTALMGITQPRPLNTTFKVYVDGILVDERSRVVRVRTINDVPFFAITRNGDEMDLGWMFAAYVNENHPLVDEILREALNTGLVNGFIGYQGTEQDVYQQVFAIWNVLQRRGFRYSSITTASGSSKTVFSQHVRLFDDAVRTSQANCVDGSVLIAAVLRKIGIDPLLAILPGHMMVGFYLNREHTNKAFLETTLMGSDDLSARNEDDSLLGALNQLLGVQTKNEASANLFNYAVSAAAKNFNNNLRGFQSGDPRFSLIDIAKAREIGVMPITQ